MSDSFEESVFEFPCDFPVKAMGLASDDFDQHVIDIVKKHSPDLKASQVKVRNSQGGKYHAVTIIVIAKSREQLDAIYQDLTDSDRVLMAL